MSETATKKKEPGMATLVIVLFAICAATALLLGLTNYVTAPFIAANNKKTTQEAMAAVLPADSYDEVEYTGGDAMVQAVYKAGDAGYVVEVKPATSFSGNLIIMVGVDNTGACSGISITSTGETSGLGSNASKPDFQAQFVGTLHTGGHGRADVVRGQVFTGAQADGQHARHAQFGMAVQQGLLQNAAPVKELLSLLDSFRPDFQLVLP